MLTDPPIILDLFCGQGGAAWGYHLAGFRVVGVDILPQPRYPFEFLQTDAVSLVRKLKSSNWSAAHASPPCQFHTKARNVHQRPELDYISIVRESLEAWGRPYVIENVPGAPLKSPVELCGAMFDIRTYRHRLFETNWPVTVPRHPRHIARNAKMGRPPADDEFMHIVGNFSGIPLARKIMGTPWMNREGLREAIPPVYTEHLGRQLIGLV